MVKTIYFIAIPSLLFLLSFYSTVYSGLWLPREYYYIFYAFGAAHALVGFATAYKQAPNSRSSVWAWVILLGVLPLITYFSQKHSQFLFAWVIGFHVVLSEAYFENNLGDTQKRADGLLSFLRLSFITSAYFYMTQVSYPLPALLKEYLFEIVCISWISTQVYGFRFYWPAHKPVFFRWLIHHSILFALVIWLFVNKFSKFDQAFFLLYHSYFWLFLPLLVAKPLGLKFKYAAISATAQILMIALMVFVVRLIQGPIDPTPALQQTMISVNNAHVFFSFVLSRSNPEFFGVFWRKLVRA